MRQGLHNKKVWLVFGLALAIAAMCAPSAAGAAQAKPAWRIQQLSHPTSLMPGTVTNVENPLGQASAYELVITNVGGEQSQGVTITDVLPSGLTPVSGYFRYSPNSIEGSPDIEQGNCAVSGQTVTCTVSAPVYGATSVKMGVGLEVSPTEGVVTNEVLVEGGGNVTSSHVPTTISSAARPFSFLDPPALFAGVSDQAGDVPAAGAHPYLTQISLPVATDSIPTFFEPSGDLRRVTTELPQGLVVNPTAVNTLCPIQLIFDSGTSFPGRTCPQEAQVGGAVVSFAGFTNLFAPIFVVKPPPGVAAALAFDLAGIDVEVNGGLGGNFHLTAGSSELLKKFRIYEVTIELWGNPSDQSHDHSREGGEQGNPEGCYGIVVCQVEPSPAPFVTMPTSCGEPAPGSAEIESWMNGTIRAALPLSDRESNPVHVTGCNQLAFEPTIASQATTNVAETSAGLDFKIHQRQEESLEGRATAALKDATVTLPEGMTLNPSAANGLSSCTEGQMGYAPEEGKILFATTPQTCPDAAKIGSIETVTPLVNHPLHGSIYLAKPFDNPFGSLLALYLAVEDEESGVVAKLAGKVEPDPSTGRLTTTFAENPELPIEDFDLHFFNGARGALTTPLTCGTKTTTSTLVPWSTPEGADAHPTGSFQTDSGCASSEGAAPKTVSFTAGTQSPLSGAYSPFVLRLSRPDGSQHITGIDTTLPAGLLGKLAGVSYCPESGIAQAISREKPEQGKTEQQSPSCPSSSEVGTVNVTAGSGITPIPVSGHAYLAGPYKGAPLSLVVIAPAVAGPFDLGTVVDRVALNVGEYDARIHAVSDPLPTIRDGIPLDVRSIELKLDRPSFTLNPTSCEAMAIEGSVSTQAGQSAALNNRFQVGECGRLAFKPKLALSLKGPTKKTGHPALKAVVTYPSQGAYANIARAQVNLPHSEFLDQGNIAKACTKVILAARACPAKSIYGKAKAWTPLLDKPLEGPVYLVGGYGYKLPALVAELDGQIRVLLVGKVDTGKNKGIRNTFEAVPDAPVEKFVLEMKGGKKYGLLENSENVCKKKQVAGTAFTAQNGKVLNVSSKIANSCGKGTKKHKGKGKGKKTQKSKH
jgi:uncharacterized repeat protein (TIGR01451 family)